jgi:hypothetical protein
MKKLVFIMDGGGGPGKTLIAHHCRQALASLHYPPGERAPQRSPRAKSKRPSGIKIRRSCSGATERKIRYDKGIDGNPGQGWRR